MTVTDARGDIGLDDAAVLVERDGLIATVTLNRPKQLNALSDELMRAIVVALLELDADRDVRAIVLTGSERAFAAGADYQADGVDIPHGVRVQ